MEGFVQSWKHCNLVHPGESKTVLEAAHNPRTIIGNPTNGSREQVPLAQMAKAKA